MKKLFVISALVALPFTSALAQDKGKPKDSKVMKTAIECALNAVDAGAYSTMTSEALADFCVDLAIRLHEADYEPESPLGCE